MRALTMRWTIALALSVLAVGCRENRPQKVPPTLRLDEASIDFGAVKVGADAPRVFVLSAANGADVALSSVTLEGAPTFSLDAPPGSIPGLGAESVTLHYRPTTAGEETATLVIRSDDELHPEVRVPVTGHGAWPALTLELACDATTGCQAQPQASPLALRFADEPFVRLRMLEAPELPRLVMRNGGEVPVVVSALALGGADAAAFSFVGNAMLPAGGLVIAPGGQQQISLRFRPTSDTQQGWSGTLTVTSDDHAAPSVTIPLSGALRPNLPPVVCVNVSRVTPQGLPPRDFDGDAGWSEALAANDGGVVDLAARRDVPPRAEVVLSALSSAAETDCTSDPEDGRLGLTWSWSLVSQPAGSTPAVLLNASTPRATFRPFATGAYTAELAVTDSQGNRSTQRVVMAVAVKNDLVVQLDWAGQPGVDLDVHLVRPGAAPFAPWFDDGGGPVSDDLNGYAATARADGGTFDWGQRGLAADDPRLNLDDTGQGPLVENISLNLPENDPACTSAACSWTIAVHGFRDARDAGAPAACVVDGGPGCLDGDACGCASGTVCVANVAAADAGASGTGRCLAAVNATVRVFLRGSPVASLSAPVTLGAPCQLVEAATIAWPARGALDAGVQVNATAGSVRRFGVRSSSSMQCAPDGLVAGVPWFREQPR